jgi:hypothetical protein
MNKELLEKTLFAMAHDHEEYENERRYLVDYAPTRLQEIAATKDEIKAAAQIKLDELNVLRVADGQQPLTLAQVIQYIRNQMDNQQE